MANFTYNGTMGNEFSRGGKFMFETGFQVQDDFNLNSILAIPRKLNKQELEDISRCLSTKSLDFLYEDTLRLVDYILKSNSISLTATKECTRPWQSKYLGVVYISNLYSRGCVILGLLLKAFKNKQVSTLMIMQKLKPLDTVQLPNSLSGLEIAVKNYTSVFNNGKKSIVKSAEFSNLIIIDSSNVFYVNDMVYKAYVLNSLARQQVGVLKSQSGRKYMPSSNNTDMSIQKMVLEIIPNTLVYKFAFSMGILSGRSKVNVSQLQIYFTSFKTSNSNEVLQLFCSQFMQSVQAEVMSNGSMTLSRVFRHFIFIRDKLVLSICKSKGVSTTELHSLESDYYASKASSLMQDYKKKYC